MYREKAYDKIGNQPEDYFDAKAYRRKGRAVMGHGMIHIYCGDGKGKTTAAIGLAVRAAGRGKKVLFARFLKNEDSGELRILDAVPEIEVIHLEKSYGFFRTLTEKEQEEARKTYVCVWECMREKAAEGSYDMVVIDEFMAAYRYGLVSHEEAIAFLTGKPEEMEIVLTGRDPDPELTELADYVSEIHKIKHPFDRGIPARKGIEY